jgi:hypothetical protein
MKFSLTLTFHPVDEYIELTKLVDGLGWYSRGEDPACIGLPRASARWWPNAGRRPNRRDDHCRYRGYLAEDDHTEHELGNREQWLPCGLSARG